MGGKLVVIGAGMASGRMLEHLFENDPGAFDVTLFGAEPRKRNRSNALRREAHKRNQGGPRRRAALPTRCATLT